MATSDSPALTHPGRFSAHPSLTGRNRAGLILTFLIRSITFVSSRTNMMQGAVHLVVFAAFLFLALVP